MFYLALGLFIVAVFLIVVDVFLEGFGILGVVGLIAMAGSLFVNLAYVPFGGWIIVVKAAILIPAGILFFRYLKRKKLYGKWILTDTLAGEQKDFSALQDFVGLKGITTSALRPYGRADFDGAGTDVYSDSTYIPVNTEIEVVRLQDNKLFVKMIET